jgi:hypothetical protein
MSNTDTTATLLELAQRHGKYQGARVEGDDPFKALHNTAAVLNGWRKQERVTSQPVQLSDEDYLLALEAAKAGEAYGPTNMRSTKGEE